MFAWQRDGDDWWKVKPKYSSKVLVGNWLEERERLRQERSLGAGTEWFSTNALEFIKGTGKLGSSIYKTDFIWFPDQKPDQVLRGIMVEKHQGLPMQHFFTHHEEPRSRNLVSEYDDKYNRHGYNPELPPIRTWSGRKFSWIPQKSDFPILEPPTNYGLYEYLRKKWHEEEAGVMNSVYTVSYGLPLISSWEKCQLQEPAKIHYLPPSQGYLQTVHRILGYEGGQKYLEAIGYC